MGKIIRRLAATAKVFKTVGTGSIESDVGDGFGVTWFVVPQTTAGSPPALTNPLKRGVQIKADPANSDIVYVGSSGVQANKVAATNGGYPLAAGETVFIPIDKLEKLYFISVSASQNICLLYA